MALVTGASRGLGAQIARRLAADGFAVAVNYATSADAADAVVADIRAAGGIAEAFGTDVTEEAPVVALLADVRQRLGPVAALVLNATGPQPTVPVAELTRKAVTAQLDYFVKSPVLLVRHALPDLMRARSPRVVHIGSDVVERFPHGNAAYVTAKTAQLGLARAQARELAAHGITVNTVAPGWVPVERHADGDPQLLEGYRRSVPLGRTGTPHDVAAAVSYLVSDAAAFVTGARLPVNGGSTLG
ncbi:SDR family oxidoreductase [Geodermatophilus sp. DSM 44513]|uniref:SDR family NAD(P)-dependent oxidoreductase n=1 Tax=Geodermatophilus sp. DSM 44513 TaxID=1528104 RepID=UPI001271E669|nr:SDR family oxidoreductase [Geodermatophilus sp. DSM 44513]WNV74287.1 SDR family oxidoreductase [Geodermatophilus sp. DSM 44513]